MSDHLTRAEIQLLAENDRAWREYILKNQQELRKDITQIKISISASKAEKRIHDGIFVFVISAIVSFASKYLP